MKMTYNQEVTARLISFGQRLFGSDYGWQTKFAAALEMTPQGLNPYFNGERLPGNTLLARLNKLGCSSDWLLYGTTDDTESVSVALMNIPIYAFAEGTKESIIMDNVVEYIAVPKSMDETMFGVKIKTESMSPVLRPKDIIIVSEKAKFKNGELCLVQLSDTRHLVRNVHIQEKVYLLSSENSNQWPPQSIPKTKIKKIMRVMKIIRSL